MRNAIVLTLSLLPIASAIAAEPRACPIPGHAVQWLADYCLFKEETDDLIAASSCMELEREQIPESDECATKLRYKARLCDLHIARGSRQGTVDDCVSDPSFSGNIVRNDGG